MNNTISLLGLPAISKTTLGIIFLTIIYIVGILGVVLEVHPDFLMLTPLNLTMSLLVMLYFHERWSRGIVGVLVLSFLTGLLLEIVGVKTGLIFGDYHYGRTLGFKVGGVPLIIGVNWAMLVYASGILVNTFLQNLPSIIKAILSAGLMVGLDVLIEPVAMKYDFWQWAGDVVPLHNYLGWFVIAFFLLLVFHYIVDKSLRNSVALALFGLQVLFFAVLNIL